MNSPLPVSEPVRLSAAGEEAWQQLRRHVEWADGFALVFLFSSDPGVVSVFRERLRSTQRLRVSDVEVLRPERADTVTEAVMEGVRAPEEKYQQMDAPWWIEINRAPGDQESAAEWDDARMAALARLNEHRELLRRNLSRPCILIFPLDFVRSARETAPDLWSVRDLSLVLAPADVIELSPADTRFLTSAATRSGRMVGGADASSDPIVREWKRLRKRTPQVRKESLRNVLLAGWQAFDAAFGAGDHELAWRIATETLELARGGESGGLETLRDVSVSLERVGDIARQRGDLEGAEQAYGESLDLGRRIVERVGETPETLRDVSVSLERVGDIARQRGDLEGAEQAYGESLDLRRRIVERVGETPETLRDVSVSLERVGDIARQRGDLEGAEQALQEATSIAGRLAHVFPAVTEYARLEAYLRAALDAIVKEAEAERASG